MKEGDKVKMKSYNGHDQVLYTILEVDKNHVKLSHPEIGGYFVFCKDMVKEIIDESG